VFAACPRVDMDGSLSFFFFFGFVFCFFLCVVFFFLESPHARARIPPSPRHPRTYPPSIRITLWSIVSDLAVLSRHFSVFSLSARGCDRHLSSLGSEPATVPLMFCLVVVGFRLLVFLRGRYYCGLIVVVVMFVFSEFIRHASMNRSSCFSAGLRDLLCALCLSLYGRIGVFANITRPCAAKTCH